MQVQKPDLTSIVANGVVVCDLIPVLQELRLKSLRALEDAISISSTTSSVVRCLQVDSATATQCLEWMINAKILESDRNMVRVTELGNSLACSKGKRFTKKSCDKAFQDLMNKIALVNNRNEFPYMIASATLYGSYLREHDDYGDIDVHIELLKKDGTTSFIDGMCDYQTWSNAFPGLNPTHIKYDFQRPYIDWTQMIKTYLASNRVISLHGLNADQVNNLPEEDKLVIVEFGDANKAKPPAWMRGKNMTAPATPTFTLSKSEERKCIESLKAQLGKDFLKCQTPLGEIARKVQEFHESLIDNLLEFLPLGNNTSLSSSIDYWFCDFTEEDKICDPKTVALRIIREALNTPSVFCEDNLGYFGSGQPQVVLVKSTGERKLKHIAKHVVSSKKTDDMLFDGTLRFADVDWNEITLKIGVRVGPTGCVITPHLRIKNVSMTSISSFERLMTCSKNSSLRD